MRRRVNCTACDGQHYAGSKRYAVCLQRIRRARAIAKVTGNCWQCLRAFTPAGQGAKASENTGRCISCQRERDSSYHAAERAEDGRRLRSGISMRQGSLEPSRFKNEKEEA